MLTIVVTLRHTTVFIWETDLPVEFFFLNYLFYFFLQAEDSPRVNSRKVNNMSS